MANADPNLVSAPSVRGRLMTRVAAPLAGFVLGWINWRYPVVRFDSQLANQVAFLGVLLLPLAAIITGTGIWEYETRWVLRLPLAPFAILGVLLGLPAAIGLVDTARLGANPAFEPIARYALDGRALTVYRTDCGAWCSYGIVVRQERHLILGLLLVRDVYREYPADSVSLRLLGGDRLEIGVTSRRGSPDSSGNRDTISLGR